MPARKKPTAEISGLIKGVVASEPPRADDSNAELERRAYLGDSRREERTKTAINLVVVAGVVIIGALIIAAIAVLIINLFLPVSYRWLTDDQVQKLYQFLFSGLVGSTLTSSVRFLQQRTQPTRGKRGR